MTGPVRVAGAGHRLLADATIDVVMQALRDRLSLFARGGACAVGISSLADGADQLFAEAILELGWPLEVIVPSHGYREQVPEALRATYDRLLACAAAVEVLDYPEPTLGAYVALARRLVERADVIVAVWDGRRARGPGGTGDVVAFARERGVPVVRVWPRGAVRNE